MNLLIMRHIQIFPPQISKYKHLRLQFKTSIKSILSSLTQLYLSQVKPVCLALSLLHSFYNITPPFFLRFTGRFSLWSIRAKASRGGINKNVLAVTRDLSAGNEGPGEEDKGGKMHAVV